MVAGLRQRAWVESNKLSHEIDRSLIWQLAQIRPMLESEALERIEEKLERLGGGQVTRLYDGRSDDDHPLISAHYQGWLSN